MENDDCITRLCLALHAAQILQRVENSQAAPTAAVLGFAKKSRDAVARV